MDQHASLTYPEAFEALRHVYLEDSWVLDVTVFESSVTFRLEAVLTHEHPRYRSPKPGDQYCYRLADMTLKGSRASLHRSDTSPATDATGEADYGNIDSFVPVDWEGEPAWELTGTWGVLFTVGPTVALAFEDKP